MRGEVCLLVFRLPASSPVDLYVNGRLMGEKLTHEFSFPTPPLPPGNFEYLVAVRESGRGPDHPARLQRVTRIQAGGRVDIDLSHAVIDIRRLAVRRLEQKAGAVQMASSEAGSAIVSPTIASAEAGQPDESR